MRHLGDCFLTLSQVNTCNQDSLLTVCLLAISCIWEKRPWTLLFFVLFLGDKLAKPKFLECLMFRLRSAFFVCVNSVISHESAITCSFYIFHLLKIVFFIALYYNISLIILTTRDARYWILLISNNFQLILADC